MMTSETFTSHIFQISSNEKKELQEKLAAAANKSAGTIETMDYFKVSWHEYAHTVCKSFLTRQQLFTLVLVERATK